MSLTNITEGAEVAVRIGMDDSHIKFRTIERLTDTLIILDDGTRFQRAGEHKQVGLGRYATRGQLVDPDAANIVDAVARTRYRDIYNAAASVSSGAGATLHRKKARDVLGELAKLAEMVEQARVEIDRRLGM